MKNTANIIATILCIVALYGKAQNNYIIAGQHGAGDYYYKYMPTDTMIEYACTGSCMYTYSVDVNDDGTNDLAITFYPGNSAMGGGSYFCNINGLNNTKIATAHVDSCIDGTTHPMAHAFNYADTIHDANTNWMNSACVTYSEWGGYPPTWSCGTSYSTDSVYIGFQITAGTQPKFGWIRHLQFVENYPSQTGYLYVNSFACESMLTGIEKLNEADKYVVIYPNPALTRLQVTPINGHIEEISLYDILGNQVVSTKEKNIDVSTLQNGVYFVRVQTNNELVSKKIIIQH